VAIGVVTGPQADAAINNYYVAVNQQEVLAHGTYTGLNNPHLNHVQILYSHPNEVPARSHFHGIGHKSYTGDVSDPTVTETNGNNRLPESYTGYEPLNLLAGDGVFAGKLVSGQSSAEPQDTIYGDLTIKPIDKLGGYADGTTEAYLFNASGGAYTRSVSGLGFELELIGITDGLNIAMTDGTAILSSVGDRYAIGSGADWSFKPVFWTGADAGPGTYTASLRLHDTSNTFGSGGVFHVDFQVVPEPAALPLLSLGVLLIGRRRR